MTLREEELLYCLKESHKLLYHYATMLNLYDEGKRNIPKSVHRWIKRLRDVKNADIKRKNIKVII